MIKTLARYIKRARRAREVREAAKLADLEAKQARIDYMEALYSDLDLYEDKEWEEYLRPPEREDYDDYLGWDDYGNSGYDHYYEPWDEVPYHPRDIWSDREHQLRLEADARLDQGYDLRDGKPLAEVLREALKRFPDRA